MLGKGFRCFFGKSGFRAYRSKIKIINKKWKSITFLFLKSKWEKKGLDILSQPLERMTINYKKEAKTSIIYECKTCDFSSSKKDNYEKHIKTIKHITLQTNHINKQNKAASLMMCKCGKLFNHRQNLWKHKQKCPAYKLESSETDEITKNELIKQLLFQNQQLICDNKEFKEMIIEQNSKMIELSTKPNTINNNNTNCHNKQFNLQVFLNEKCKNAMNMTDFISSLEIMSDDLEDIGKLGYVQGISNIFMKGLKDLDETERPIHCTDKKRETLYIKNSNVWDKDDNREKMNLVIKELAHKNFKYIPIWTDANPSYNDGTTKKNDQYMRIVNQVMTCITPDDESGFNKIIKNVASKVCIDRSVPL